MPAITVRSETKYDTRLKAKSKKVSIIGLTLRNRQCLNTKLVRKPKKRPIVSETIPSMKNSPMISKGVYHAKAVD